MRSLYNKITLKQAWNMAEGFHEALKSMYKIYLKNNEQLLQYPMIDLAFHTMEKIAFVLLTIKKGSYVGKHSNIKDDFIREFKTFTVFNDIIGNYPKIFNAKDALMYEFESLLDEKIIDLYIRSVLTFKERAETYLASKGAKL